MIAYIIVFLLGVVIGFVMWILMVAAGSITIAEKQELEDDLYDFIVEELSDDVWNNNVPEDKTKGR